jgi:hypothetical protein
LSYQWQKNRVDIPGGTLATYVTPPTTAADNGSAFRVVISNIAGSVTSAERTLTVMVPPMITIQPQDATVFGGKVAKFSVLSTGTKILSYQWMKNGAPIDGAIQPMYATAPVTPSDNGALFSVVVKNNYGTVTSRSALLTVK